MPFLGEIFSQLKAAGNATVLQEIWGANPLLRQYLGRIDNPEFILYRIRPTRVRYMKEWALEYCNVPLDSAENATGHASAGAAASRLRRRPDFASHTSSRPLTSAVTIRSPLGENATEHSAAA